MTNLEWALRYFRAGWQIMPCRDKHPLPEALGAWENKWEPLKEERVTERIINWWWTKFPDAQIALICGKLSGISVVDCDWIKDENHKPLKDQGEKPWDIAATFDRSITSITGSDGRHVFCQYAEVTNTAKVVHPQIDIRSEGGYVILPPSLHESGMRYEWDMMFPFEEENLKSLAKFPQSLIDKSKEKMSPEEWDKILAGASVGSRNSSAAQVIGKLLTILPMEAVWKLVRAWNIVYNTPPLPEQELWKTFISITKRDYANYPRR